MKDSVIGMDIAKQVFQLHTVNRSSGTIERIKLRRAEVLPFFANYPISLVAIEACGSAHWWARQLQQLGHEVRLLAPRSVRPFVLRNKTDAADAQAIWTAVQQPGACTVAIKQVDQQAILSLHRLRAQLLKFRIMQSNALRGLFYEFGMILPEGYAALVKVMPDAFAQAENQVPELLLESLREQWQRMLRLDEEIQLLERRLKRCMRDRRDCRALAEIPGIGLLTATTPGCPDHRRAAASSTSSKKLPRRGCHGLRLFVVDDVCNGTSRSSRAPAEPGKFRKLFGRSFDDDWRVGESKRRRRCDLRDRGPKL